MPATDTSSLTTPHEVPPVRREVAADIQLAESLSAPGVRVTGPTAEALRRRLREYIRDLIARANDYAVSLGDSTMRETVREHVRFASRLAIEPHTDPRHDLRLLSQSVTRLAGYADFFNDRRIEECCCACHAARGAR